MKNRPVIDLIDYVVCTNDGATVNVRANHIFFSEEAMLFFKIIYVNETEMTVAAFKDWKWFNIVAIVAKEKPPEV